jgi:hypothetical protein
MGSLALEVGGEALRLELPPSTGGDVASVFLAGLPKAGSTLLNRLMRPITQAAGLAFYALPEELRSLGVRPADFPAELTQLFQPKGYAFGGFRSLPGQLRLPPFAKGRTILLVRDPRDMLTSLYFSIAFSHAPPGSGAGGKLAEDFERRRREATGGSIDEFVLGTINTVQGQFRQVENKLKGLDAKVYRYEDIIFDKQRWAEDMVAHLGLPAPAEAVSKAVAANDVKPTDEDPSRHVRKVAPGDHADKLKPETIRKLNEGLAEILERYSYT